MFTDRDECSEWGFCDQQCRNTEGSFLCSCFPGFELVDNNRTCVASRIYAPSLVYFAHDKSILRMDARGQNQEVIANGSSVSSLDYHYTKNFLFWIDVKTKKVSSGFDPSELRPSNDLLAELSRRCKNITRNSFKESFIAHFLSTGALIDTDTL